DRLPRRGQQRPVLGGRRQHHHGQGARQRPGPGEVPAPAQPPTLPAPRLRQALAGAVRAHPPQGRSLPALHIPFGPRNARGPSFAARKERRPCTPPASGQRTRETRRRARPPNPPPRAPARAALREL
ncbi:MAG: hypothetical protein AVDCRST_MAG01-01-3839, partial [uncultured Rubrobacteraceae bacterium]